MCKICINNPGSHSFEYIGVRNGRRLYYTCPAKATMYWDTEGILKHYEEVLEQNGEHPWTWLFDGEDFGFMHSLQIATAIGIIDLLKNKYGKCLMEIRIINPTVYIKSLYRIIYPFLDEKIDNMIQWID